MSAAHEQPDRDKHWTVADYMQLDDEHRYEVLQGELVMAPVPAGRHQHVSMLLSVLIGGHVRARRLGRCFAAPFDVALGEDTVVQPDLLFISAARWAALDDGHGITGAPDLVVEILSPSTAGRDRITKRALYQQASVAWLVLVDPAARSVEVFRLHEGSYVIDAAALGDQTLRLGLFPELELPLAELWLDDGAPDTAG